MRRVLLVFVLVLLSASAVQAATETVNVVVRIDGLSDLYLRGNTAWWHHLQWGAPETTWINGVRWDPTGMSDFCGCDSDVFTRVDPPIPFNATNFSLTVNDGRGTVTIEQTPNQWNGGTLRLRFDDVDQGGADEYDVTISYTVPEPIPAASPSMLALLALLIVAMGAWVLRR